MTFPAFLSPFTHTSFRALRSQIPLLTSRSVPVFIPYRHHRSKTSPSASIPTATSYPNTMKNNDITRLHPAAHFSQATIHNDTVYLSGQVARNTDGTTASQTRAILSKIDALLSDAGTDKSRLLTATVWLSDISTAPEMNAEWDAWLADLTKPSRATVEARLVDDEITVEIQATAALRPAIRPIQTARAAPAVGPYNQAVVAGGNVYVSGCIGLDEKGMMVGDSVSAQTERALANMREILNESGVDVASVVKTTVLLHDMDDFAAVNEVYASFFEGGIVPARACFAAKQLPKGALVEIDAVAIVN